VSRYVQLASVVLLLSIQFGCGPNASTPSFRQEEHGSAKLANRAVDRYDLERDERRGGHTLSRHVARTDEQLAGRLRAERNISAASTWTDRETAEETVAAALRAEHGRVESWMRRGEQRPNLALHFETGRAVGRSLRRNQGESDTCTSVVIVLRAHGSDGFYVLTTYPEARE